MNICKYCTMTISQDGLPHHAGSCISLELDEIKHENARLKEELAKIQGKALSCCFCGFKCANLEGLKVHSAECKEHPLFRELAYWKRVEARGYCILTEEGFIPLPSEMPFGFSNRDSVHIWNAEQMKEAKP